ncbi:MAG: cytidylyltransferase family protein [Candidatus Nezhaarchaeota archaeon]|nr:cytidylyltransferase family protein [Candidatus Nezhaarchaeota archaeon]
MDLPIAIEDRLAKCLASLGEVFREVELKEGSKEARETLDLAYRYYLDALYYRDRDPSTALACASYSEGLLDALRILGLASFKWPTSNRIQAAARKVLVAGVFDLIHPGHLYFLQQAKELGEVYVVVARDSTVEKVKGRRPVVPENQRLKVVSQLKPVDRALLGEEGDLLKVVEQVKPDVILLGPNQPFSEERLKEELKRRGLEVQVLRIKEVYKDCELYSSSMIIKEVLSRWHEPARRCTPRP